MRIFQATLEHLEALTPLFVAYREFHGAMPATALSKEFLQQRIEKQESVIFVAVQDEQLLGFCQVYPSFSSLSLRPVWILNDIFVKEEHRGKQIAEKLIRYTLEQAAASDVVRIRVSISQYNEVAQRLFESTGFAEDPVFRNYIQTMA